MILDEKQNILLREALSSTFGNDYNINQINKLYGGGSIQHSFEIIINDSYHLICRFIEDNKTKENRAQERICTQRASDMDVGPQLIYFDDKDSILLLEKAKGSHLTLSQLQDQQIQIAILSQLNIWHQADHENITKTPDIIDKINNLVSDFSNNIYKSLGISSINELTKHCTNTLSTKNSVIHGDVNPSNIILLPSGTVHLIDWSSAGIGETWLDFAMVSQYLNNTNFWYSIVTEHNGTANTENSFKTYNYLLHLHCCFWALQQAAILMELNNINEPLDNLVTKQELSCSIKEIQGSWLNNQFDHNDHTQYILLAKLMMNFCKDFSF